jgi:hypothetical protein
MRKVYPILEKATEYLIYCILLFTPWAFGTTEHWAINTVNELNYILGGLLVAKWITRGSSGESSWPWNKATSGEKFRGYAVWVLAALNVVILGLTVVYAVNARAQFIFEATRFEYFDNYKPWLPYSYDLPRTWEAFRLYLAVSCFFWALRDWLAGHEARSSHSSRRHRKEEAEESRHQRHHSERVEERRHSSSRAFARVSRLLWVICMNGAILAFQGIVQRLSGSHRLLWLVQPHWNRWGDWQFGPFNYRTNAAQYLNLIWPACFGLWWLLNRRRTGKLGNDPSTLLLPLLGLMMAAPVITSSRGGLIIDVLQVFGTGLVLALLVKRVVWWKVAITLGICALVLGGAASLEWRRVQARFNEKTLDTLNGRTVIYQNARKIAADFPKWGTGPGSFAAMYHLYREDPEQTWFAFAHDDYLQTLITFGRVGLAIILGALILTLVLPFGGGGIPAPKPFAALLWMAVAGCLVHAKFDFPFQIYSILLLFVTLCAILSCCTLAEED